MVWIKRKKMNIDIASIGWIKVKKMNIKPHKQTRYNRKINKAVIAVTLFVLAKII